MAGRLTVTARGAGAGPGVVCRRSYAGRADQVRAVRAFLAGVLAGCPAAADAVLLADELAANAVLYSRSGGPGGRFTVLAEVREGQWVRVEVEDDGGPETPHLCTAGCSAGQGGDTAETDGGGRGLQIVQALSQDWGVTGGVTGRTVWFQLGWGTP